MSDESTEEPQENETREERKKRLARLRTRKYRAKNQKAKQQQEWLSRFGKKDKGEFDSEPSKQKDNQGFDNLEHALQRTFGKSEEQKIAENKALENAINQSLENQTIRNICRVCRSNPCHCDRQTLYQNGD